MTSNVNNLVSRLGSILADLNAVSAAELEAFANDEKGGVDLPTRLLRGLMPKRGP